MRTAQLTLVITVLFIVFFGSCKKDPVLIDDTGFVDTTSSNGLTGILYIGNEGNFQWNNASVTKIDLVSSLSINGYYNEINGESVGDVCHSLVSYDNNIFIIVNNSGKVIKADAQTWEEVDVLEGLASPRHLQVIDGGDAIVSDLYSKKLLRINLGTMEIVEEIAFSHWSEKMFVDDNMLYVTTGNHNKLFMIDLLTNSIVDSLEIGYGSGGFSLIQDSLLYILCAGDYYQEIDGGLFCLNTKTNEIITSYNISGYPKDLFFSSSTNSLYYLNKDLMEFNLSTNQLSTKIPSNNKNFYAFEFIEDQEIIVLTDAKDYLQSGSVEIYSIDGEKIEAFDAGIIPGSILYLP